MCIHIHTLHPYTHTHTPMLYCQQRARTHTQTNLNQAKAALKIQGQARRRRDTRKVHAIKDSRTSQHKEVIYTYTHEHTHTHTWPTAALKGVLVCVCVGSYASIPAKVHCNPDVPNVYPTRKAAMNNLHVPSRLFCLFSFALPRPRTPPCLQQLPPPFPPPLSSPLMAFQ